VKKIVFLLIFVSYILVGSAQKLRLEPGILIGTSYYLGDVNHVRQFYSPELSYGIIVRYPLNEYYAFRINVLKARISGNDADFSSLYQQIRGHAFSTNIYEIAFLTEFNFLSYNSNIKKSYSPYLTFGIGAALSQSSSIAFPMGVGWKYSFGKKTTLSAEWVFRNTTTDQLDLLVPADVHTKQRTKVNNVDWYSIAAISITYNIAPEKRWCPAYNRKK
jgi:hypothetical protein